MYIFLDVDGTLYSKNQRRVPESAQKAIDETRKLGNKVFLCTGRNRPACGDSLNVTVDGFIFSSGALVEDGGKIIYNHPFSNEEVNYIKERIQAYNLGYTFECSKGSYCDKLGYMGVTNYFTGGLPNEENNKVTAAAHFFLENGNEDDCVYKIAMYSHTLEEMEPIFKDIPDTMLLNILTTEEDPYCIGELTRIEDSKASGIKHIVEYEQGSMKDTVGMGDSSNDISMLEVCNISIAMGNGQEEVKEIADFVTKDIDEDGLEYAFKKFGLIK